MAKKSTRKPAAKPSAKKPSAKPKCERDGATTVRHYPDGQTSTITHASEEAAKEYQRGIR